MKKGRAEYIVARHENHAVKIYSSERKVAGSTYEEHCVTFSEGGKRVRRRFGALDDAKAEAERVLIAMANGATKALTLTNADASEYPEIASKLGRSAVGCAGWLGEYLESDPDADLWDVLELFDMDRSTLSATDLSAIEFAAPINRPRTARIAFDAVREQWPLVLRLTDYLAREAAAHGTATARWQRERGWRGQIDEAI